MAKPPLHQAVADRILRMVEDIQNLDLPKLGPAFKDLYGADLHEALVAHRCTKKYERPQKGKSVSRRETSIHSFLDTNASLDTDFDYRLLTPPNRRVFLGAREWLRILLKDFKPSYQFAFPSGESVNGEQGLTDMYHKLSLESQWTVSLDASPYAARVAYNTLFLKRVVRARFREEWPLRWRRMAKAWHSEALAKGFNESKAGLYCFERMFLSVCEVVGVSRVTTVPKDNTKDRVITCEPTWNMVAQLSLALDLRELLRRGTGIDVSFWQNVHRALIRSGRATIDFSDASNCNRWSVVKALFPQKVVTHLSRLRNGVFEYSGTYYPVSMFAPMGAGFTFDMLTLTLLAYARQFDANASAYGDDIIMSQDRSTDFISFVEELGWKVNTSKSFLEGNFRESCGAFADLSRDELLESYDLVWPESSNDAYICINKIRRMRNVLRPKGGRVLALLAVCYGDLLNLIPRDTIVDRVDDDLMDWLVTDPEEDHKAVQRQNAILAVWGQQWQRTIRVVQASTFRQATSNAVKHNVSLLRAACYFRQGSSYKIPLNSFKVAIERREVQSSVTLSRVTLVSVL